VDGGEKEERERGMEEREREERGMEMEGKVGEVKCVKDI
jgi:hypothetical protein